MTNTFPAALRGTRTRTGAGYDPNFKTGYYQHWNLGVERELPGKMSVSVSYEGKKGTHLLRDGGMNNNQPTITQAVANAALRDASRPFPLFGNINWSDSAGDSIYHAGQTKVEKRFTQGLSFIFGYTFSKAIDTGNFQNAYDQPASRGLASADNRHRLQFSYVYDLPFGPGSRFPSNLSGVAGKLVGGWEISGIYVARSGQPFTPAGRATSPTSAARAFCLMSSATGGSRIRRPSSGGIPRRLLRRHPEPLETPAATS